MWKRTALQHVGKTFGRLKIVEAIYVDRGGKAKESVFVCRCTCGKGKRVLAAYVLRGTTRSCGCARQPGRDFESKEYRAWLAMKQRCTNPNNPSYPNYGAKGVRVASVWIGRGGFDKFFLELGKAPTLEHSLDRIDPRLGYGPGNVRWATPSQQACNKKIVGMPGRPSTLKDKVYAAWKSMIRRCESKTDLAFRFYGARGVTVCRRWHRFSCFLADMGLPPTKHHSLDRIDGRKGYAPENCRWATAREQGANRSTTILVRYRGRTYCVSEWARRLQINHQTLRYQLFVKERTIGNVIKEFSR